MNPLVLVVGGIIVVLFLAVGIRAWWLEWHRSFEATVDLLDPYAAQPLAQIITFPSEKAGR